MVLQKLSLRRIRFRLVSDLKVRFTFPFSDKRALGKNVMLNLFQLLFQISSRLTCSLLEILDLVLVSLDESLSFLLPVSFVFAE